jgi:hypothetical protein
VSLPGGRAFAMAPGVANVVSGQQILQSPGTYNLFTFSAAGRIWGAMVSYAMGCSAGSATQQGYARVFIPGSPALVLAVVECCIAGAVANDSNSNALPYNGIPVPEGTQVKLDVNGGGGVTGGVNRGSGLVVVSIP